jgi:SOS-response transcriptional repressor LexA
MEIHELRLRALRWEIAKFPSIAAFARHYKLDVTYVSQLLNGHRNLGEKAARTLEGKFGWPSMSMDFPENDWDTGTEASVATPKVRAVDKTRGSARQARHFFSTLPGGIREVPVISSVQAGLWREAVDSYAPGAGQDYVVVQADLGSHAFALKVRGNSMEPEFKEGDTIIVDPDLKPSPGDFVVARNADQEATFKKYRPRGQNAQGVDVIELVPLNEDYPILRSDVSPIEIIGTLVEHRRYRKPREIN